jgi:hypothetical protein
VSLILSDDTILFSLYLMFSGVSCEVGGIMCTRSVASYWKTKLFYAWLVLTLFELYIRQQQ